MGKTIQGKAVRNNSSLVTRYLSLNEGFTLLEVLVALTLLSIALLVIIRLFSANLRGISVSEDHVAAASRAEAKMREALADDALPEAVWTEDADGYRIESAVRETLKERTANLQVKLLEVDVKVSWMRGHKDKSLTLRTLKLVERKI